MVLTVKEPKMTESSAHSSSSSLNGLQIIGRWIITEMESWDPESFNMGVQAFIEFGPEGRGRFQFYLVQGFMDYCVR